MVHEPLADQLRRIGLLPGVAVALAAALATFAFLDQVMPINSRSTAPRILSPASSHGLRLQPIAAPENGDTGAGLAAAERSTQNFFAAKKRDALKNAQALLRGQSRARSTLARRPARIPHVIPIGKTSGGQAPPAPPQTQPPAGSFQQTTKPSGRVPSAGPHK